MTNKDLDLAIYELNRTFNLPIYEGFDVAWIAVVKMANFLPGESEHRRLIELLKILPNKAIQEILNDENVENFSILNRLLKLFYLPSTNGWTKIELKGNLKMFINLGTKNLKKHYEVW